MNARPHVVMSAAMSLDGCIDDRTPRRLVLSDAVDLDEVDELRAGCDAIMVGATTVRRDNPRLLVRSAERQRRREASGRPRHPLRVTISASGRLDPACAFFTGPGEAVVYGPVAGVPAAALTDLAGVLADLRRRGVRRLLVEGGQRLNSQFLAAGAVDELRLAVAPLLVGDPGAPRLAEGELGLGLRGVRVVGRMAVLDYARAADG